MRSRVAAATALAALCFLAVASAPAGAATITVNSTADNATADNDLCTLREAINNANSASGDTTMGDCATGSTPAADRIQFNIGSGSPVISPASGLPAITENTEIRGNEGAGGADRVVLNGTGAGATTDGLRFTSTADGSDVRSMVIQNFGDDGIVVEASSVDLFGNRIGTSADGSTDAGNGGDGVLLFGNEADSNQVGGDF